MNDSNLTQSKIRRSQEKSGLIMDEAIIEDQIRARLNK